MNRFSIGTILLLFLSNLIFSADTHLTVQLNENTLSIEKEKRILDYRYTDVPFKPYVKRLYSPRGINILRDAPFDHIHHHGLMFAVSLDGIDFWAEKKGMTAYRKKTNMLPDPGIQKHVRFLDMDVVSQKNREFARFVELIFWITPKTSDTLAVEQRTLCVSSVPDLSVALLSWRSRLTVPESRDFVTLSGYPFSGLGMRLQQKFDQGDFILADDQKIVQNHQPGEWIETDKASRRASWCAYQSESGIPITIALFDHPDNIRFPATWFLMSEPYALPVATIDPFRQPLRLNPENGLDLCYGIALWDGLTRKKHIDQLYKRWVDLTDLLLD